MLSEAFQADVPGSMFVYPVREDVELPPAFVEHALVPDDSARPPGRRDRREPRPLGRRVVTGDRRALSAGPRGAVPSRSSPSSSPGPCSRSSSGALRSGDGLDLPWDVLTQGVDARDRVVHPRQATVSTGVTLVAGLPLAWALARFSFRRPLARGGARAGAVRAADGRRRDGVPRPPPGRGRAHGLGDPPRARLLQRRRRRARRGGVLGGARPPPRRRRRDARRRPAPAPCASPCPSSPPRWRAPPRSSSSSASRRSASSSCSADPVRDARVGDLHPGGAALRPPGGRRARAAAAGGRRRHGRRLGHARARPAVRALDAARSGAPGGP